MNILLAVDGSSYTKKMLIWLTAHNDWLSAPHMFTAMTVVTPVTPHAASMFNSEELKSSYQSVADEIFKPIRKFLTQHDLTTRYVHKVGHAGELIAKVAEKDKFDLVIMGSHGHGGLMNLVMGSVVTQVMARCKTPILLVR